MRPGPPGPPTTGGPPADGPASWAEGGGRHRREFPPGAPDDPAQASRLAAARPGSAGHGPRGGVQGGTVQGGTVQGGTVQGGTVQGGTVQGGTVQGGAVQGGAVQAGGARARVRRKPGGPGPFGSPVRTQPGHAGQGRAADQGRGAGQEMSAGQGMSASQGLSAGQGVRAGQDQAAATPWYELGGSYQRADGSKHCGSIEPLVRRQWENAETAPAEALHAIERLAELPQKIKDLLAAGVDAIYVGEGGVPELDDMGRLRGVALPSGRATWDACAGAYGDRKIVVGTRPSPSPDVMCHEVGHAIDDSDAPPGRWQSDSAEFRMLYDQCLPHLVSDFHRQQGALGRREFFADAFAAIASRQRPALVDMLGGSTRVALNVMLFFNRRYGI
jgi:hypothetical protein